MEKIALFGGSFDPPHLAHTAIAEAALKDLALDRILFIPCRLSPHKEDSKPAPGPDRLQMLSLATESNEFFRVSDIELQRDGLSYSIDTVETVHEQYPDAMLFWIMGSDQWDVLDSWFRIQELSELVEFIVFPRPKEPQPQSGKRLHVIDKRLDISSSQIRLRIRRGESVDDMLHPAVMEWIDAKKLYQYA